jgi:hypothetical protein
VQFVACESCGVGQRLADVFLFEVGQVVDDFEPASAVGDEVDHVSDGDAKTADHGSPGQDIWLLRDAIERVRQDLPPRPPPRPGSHEDRKTDSLTTAGRSIATKRSAENR